MLRGQQAQPYYYHVNSLYSYYLLLLKANQNQYSGLEDQDSIIKESQDKKEKEPKKSEPVKEKILAEKKETEETKEASQRLFQIKPEQHVVEKPLSSREQEKKSETVPQKQPSPIQNRSNKTPSRGNPSPKPVHQSSPSPQSRQLTRKDQPHPPEDVPQDPQILSQTEHKRFASQDYTQVMNLANKAQKISFEEKLKIQHQQKLQEKEKEQSNANQIQKNLNLKLKQQKTVNEEKTTSLMDSLFNQRDTSAMRSVQKYKQSRAQNRPNSITSNLVTIKQQTNEKGPNQSVKNNAQKRKQAGRQSVDYQGEQIDSSKEIKENNQENSQSFMHANTIDFTKRQQSSTNGNIPDLKIHKGPFDIGSVSTKAVNILIQEMYKVLELYKVLYKKVSSKYRMENEASYARNKISSLKSNFADWKSQRLSITWKQRRNREIYKPSKV